MRHSLLLAASAASLLSFLACGRDKAVPPVAAKPAGQGGLTGTVQEVIPAAPYTYLRIKAAQGDLWAAVPAAEVKTGQTVTVQVQMRMDRFESPSLKRTFENLHMGTLAGSEAPAGAPMGMPAPAPQAPAGPDEKVAKATGAEARTVAEVFQAKTALKEKTVAIRGKVVKYNEGIMGRNWLHLRDGSGSASAKDNDITVTTKDACKVGDVVTVRGVVRLSKDFGAGYAYDVIVEEAKVVK
ncbi:MAG TPA: OB-fold nucleic acid binding domain-containing protein [Holophaga sp.]|nr:OB-fold nucleic acid binding domain-containing protein [Holophaga sp.]